jgi:hypothetical protein
MVSLPLSTPWNCISTKEIDCPYFGSDQHHVTWGAEMPQQIQDDTPSLNCQTYTINTAYSIQWNSHLMFLNLAFISILPQRNVKWGFSSNGVCKENLNILPDCFVCVRNIVSYVNLLHSVHVSVHWNLFCPAPSNIFVHINTASRRARTILNIYF